MAAVSLSGATNTAAATPRENQEYLMCLIRVAAILAIDNRFRTPSLDLKCLGTSFGAQRQTFSIPRNSTWQPCD